MKVLNWKLFPVTLVNWANWYMQMWDLYSQRSLTPIYGQGVDFTFKCPNEISYQRYRSVFQFLDAIILDS
jgi:hypothetical protein